MAREGELAGYSCPGCGHSRLPRVNGPRPIFECPRCGRRVHEAVAEEWETLSRLAERDDDVAEIATRLLETGGVADGS